MCAQAHPVQRELCQLRQRADKHRHRRPRRVLRGRLGARLGRRRALLISVVKLLWHGMTSRWQRRSRCWWALTDAVVVVVEERGC